MTSFLIAGYIFNASEINLFLSNTGKDVSAKCQVEMQDFASQLFADYKLNPEVVAHCSHHLEKDCKDQMKAEGGALDCLMGLGDKLNQSCYEAVWDHFLDCMENTRKAAVVNLLDYWLSEQR